MSTRAKLGLAIVAVAFLLANPMGACPSMSSASAPAHPCCPVKQAPPTDCQGLGCICVNAPQAPVTVPANDDQGVALDLPEIALPSAPLIVRTQCPTFASVHLALPDRYLSFHQLLL